MTSLAQEAEGLARELHAGHVYDGTSYDFVDFHLVPIVRTVEQLGGTETDKAVSWLHDSVEDTGVTLDELADRGMTDEVVSGVDLLTHWSNLTHLEYLLRLAADADSAGRKVVDSTVNFDKTLKLQEQMSGEDFNICLHKYGGNLMFLAQRLPAVGMEPAWARFALRQAQRAQAILHQQFGQAAVSRFPDLWRPAFAS